MLPLHSLKFFPCCLNVSSRFESVNTCNTSFAFVNAFVAVVASASDFVIVVTSSPSNNTCMFSAFNELVTLLVKSTPASAFVLPLNVIVIFLSSLLIADLSFTHSVLYFGFIVPVV